MTKRLTDQEKRNTEENHFIYNFTQDLKDLIDDIPMDGTYHIRTFPSNEEATKYRGTVYAILRSVRTYKFYKPWLGDKIWRIKVSVQGNNLVLWVKPSRYFDEGLRNSKTMAYNRQTLKPEDEPKQAQAMGDLEKAFNENPPKDNITSNVKRDDGDIYENMGKK